MHQTLWVLLRRLFCSPIAGLGGLLLDKILDSRNEEHVSPRAEKLAASGNKGGG